MSCNYYIRTRDLDMVFDLMPRVNMLKEEREFEIHLCQTACGLTPSMETHSYNTFKELKDVLLNKNYKFRIVDEYNMEYKPEEFIEMIIENNKNNTPRREIYPEFLNDNSVDEDEFEWCDYEFC